MKLSNVTGLTPAIVLASTALFSTNSLANDCSQTAQWQKGNTYMGGNTAVSNNNLYEAKWWTQTNPLTHSTQWGKWRLLGECTNTSELMQQLIAGEVQGQATAQAVTRMFLMVPSDKTIDNSFVHAANHAAKHVQDYYTTQVEGGRTFTLNRRHNAVEVLYSDKDENWFTYNNPDNKDNYVAWGNTAQETYRILGSKPSNETWIIYGDALAVDDNAGAAHAEFGIMMRDDLLGLSGRHEEMPTPHPFYDSPYRWLGGLAHEAGHAFSLPHDEKSETNIMYTGYPYYADVPLVGDAELQKIIDQNRFMSLLPLYNSVFEQLEIDHDLPFTDTLKVDGETESDTIYFRTYPNGSTLAIEQRKAYLINGNTFAPLGSVDTLFANNGGKISPESSDYLSAIANVNYNNQQLVNGKSGKCLQAAELTLGAVVNQLPCQSKNSNQEWSMVSVAGKVQVRHQATDYCVSMPNNDSFSRAVLAKCDSRSALQLWNIEAKTNEQFNLVNESSLQCLDTEFGSISDNTPMIQYSCTGAESMLWKKQ